LGVGKRATGEENRALRKGLLVAEMVRVDFHVHTPQSADFIGGGSVMDVLKSAKSSGTDILVLTDHNGIDGYLEIADRLGEVSPMLVLPGIEITCRGGSEGIHILGVMDPSRLGKRPRWLLNAVGLRSGDRHSGGLSDLDVVAATAAIRSRGGFVIAAHAMSTKGVLKSLRGRQLERVMHQCSFEGLEMSTSGQKRAGIERLGQLGLLEASTIVSGSDSHRVASLPGGRRPEGPGDRPTLLPVESPWSYSNLLAAVRATAGRVGGGEVPHSRLDAFRAGGDSSIVAVWRASDVSAVTRAVASVATAGGGYVLVGVRRAGQGGRGLVFASSLPSPREIEAWIWDTVTPIPAVEVRSQTAEGSTYIEVEIEKDFNPFVYCVDGRPLIRSHGRIGTPRLDSRDQAAVLQALRSAIDQRVLNALSSERNEWLAVEALAALFPWRGYLTDEESSAALRMVAYRLSKGADSSILLGWAYVDEARFREEAIDLVRSVARGFTLSEAKTKVRARLEEIGASRILRRRVTSAFQDAIAPSDIGGMSDEVLDSATLIRTCERLGRSLADDGFEGSLRDAAIDETKRTNDLLATLVSDEQVRVMVDVVVSEAGEEAGDQIRAALIDSHTPVVVMPVEGSEEVSASNVVLLASDGSEMVATGSTVIAVHAPVRGVSDMLRSHRRMDEFAPGHTIARNEILSVIAVRGDLSLDAETRLLLFRSCVHAGLPAWWSVDSLDLTLLADSVAERLPAARGVQEVAGLLRALALLPGDYEDVAEAAASASRAQSVHDLALHMSEPWSTRVRILLDDVIDGSLLAPDAVQRGGEPIEVDGRPIASQIADGSLDIAKVERWVAEACARQLKNVSSETLFDLMVRGVVAGWSTVSGLKRSDEATYVPDAIRRIAQPVRV